MYHCKRLQQIVSVVVFGPVIANEPADGTHPTAPVSTRLPPQGVHSMTFVLPLIQAFVTVAVEGDALESACCPAHPSVSRPETLASPVVLRVGVV